MKLSVIIPTLNEATSIVETLAPLQAMREQLEVIVVDGGSDDATCTLAEPLADKVLLHSETSKAQQMNTGALAATAITLVFLHTHTRVPDNFVTCVRRALAETESLWGRFDVHLEPSSPWLNLVARVTNWRSRFTGVCTGDHVIFVRRSIFHDYGRFADIPLMEDIELTKRLRYVTPPACLEEKVVTSPRRWQKHGVWRTIALMWWLRFLYWIGVSPHTLARKYYPHRNNS